MNVFNNRADERNENALIISFDQREIEMKKEELKQEPLNAFNEMTPT